MLVYGLDLWFHPNAVLLWLSMILQEIFITFTKQQWGEIRFFLFEQHRLSLFVNCNRQTVLCLSMFVLLFCNCFVPFVPLISSANCMLFFRLFVNFIFSNFKTILLCLHVILLVSFNNSFIVNL